MRERRHSDRATPMLVVLVLISFLLMTFDIRTSGGGAAGTLREGAQALFAPVQELATSVVSPVVDFIDGLANLAGLRDENESLRRRIAELEARIDEVGTLEAELETARRILDLELPDERIPTEAARVIARGDNFDSSFTIDKGTNDGLVVGNPVVDDNGSLVGEISVATPSSATVVPIIRPTGAVTVESQTGETGVVLGQGLSRLIFEVNPATEPVFADYLLVTAGSAKYPPGIAVAKVAESAGPEAAKIRTDAIPLADFNRLRIVVVLQWTFTAQEFEQEVPADSGESEADEPAEESEGP